MTTTPLTVLDLVPISSGSNATQALRNSIDLAQQTERLGYTRYWFAEHHLNPGVAGTSPAVVLGLTAAATSTIRLGSGAVQMGHRTALSTVEEFGLLDALHPGRFDLGLGVWSDADRELVADRVDTQFTGTPGQVADQLERLRDATEADELIVTTITHDHADRVRSYQLLAEEWARR
jgi:alkanesulfonate monooxygenase SsuD/methylene tetrahydromethanopterin reductase-like flavin-dependent oxidoreductase (luciferase family)